MDFEERVKDLTEKIRGKSEDSNQILARLQGLAYDVVGSIYKASLNGLEKEETKMSMCVQRAIQMLYGIFGEEETRKTGFYFGELYMLFIITVLLQKFIPRENIEAVANNTEAVKIMTLLKKNKGGLIGFKLADKLGRDFDSIEADLKLLEKNLAVQTQWFGKSCFVYLTPAGINMLEVIENKYRASLIENRVVSIFEKWKKTALDARAKNQPLNDNCINEIQKEIEEIFKNS